MIWSCYRQAVCSRSPALLATEPGALAAAVGPSLGAYVVHTLGWPWPFFINVPVGLVGLALSLKQLKESKSVELGALPDIPGILMLSCGMGAIALGVVKSSEWGWASTTTEGATDAGLAALTGFVLWAARVNAPALDRSAPSSGAAPASTHSCRTIRWRRT
jgi:MFS family permease